MPTTTSEELAKTPWGVAPHFRLSSLVRPVQLATHLTHWNRVLPDFVVPFLIVSYPHSPHSGALMKDPATRLTNQANTVWRSRENIKPLHTFCSED